MLAIQEEPCDLRILGTSPVFGKDYFGNHLIDFVPPFFEEGVAAEVHVECGPSYDERDYIYSESTSATTSCGTSVTSEYSDDSYIDMNDEEFDPFPETNTVSLDFQSLEERLNDSKWSRNSHQKQEDTCKSCDGQDSEEEELLPLHMRRNCSSGISKLRSSRKSECPSCCLRKKMEKLSWKEMSPDDQMEAIEYLTRLASNTLGLREQLDIIRIISPNARVLPTDTEFVIDLDAFDDIKFQSILQYVSQHLPTQSCSQCLEFRRKRCRQNSSSNSSHHKHSKRKSHQPLSTKRISRKSRKGKGLLARVHRQMEKERRSGLFKKEEVISLRTITPTECEEDIEVDILC